MKVESKEPKIYSPYSGDGLTYSEIFKKSIIIKVVPRALTITAFSVLIVGLWKYWEGRRLWSTMTTSIRNLARYILVSVAPKGQIDPEKKVAFDLLEGFAFATKDYLREKCYKYYEEDSTINTICLNLERESLSKNKNEGNKANYIKMFNLKGKKDLKGRNLITPKQIIDHNLPLDIALYLNYYITSKSNADTMSVTQMYNNLNTLTDCLTSLERVLRSPIPYAYAIHLLHTTWIFCLSLPFQLVGDLEWVTVPIVFFASFILLGVEEIADEIENPFGTDHNDLAIDSFCDLIKMELDFIKKHGDTTLVKKDMDNWWKEAAEKTKNNSEQNPEKKSEQNPEKILEKNPAKKNETNQEVDEIKIDGKKSNDEKDVNQYGDDSAV
ncbi:15434_t:CDS:2 [Cetraspora pellucida]|uniref:15434_t:CDS:1 n=1 Tax=Cetraspora pellucida TaxID=1433469 RepID=A0A9N8ZPY8_9GLOM|nr:15434_t:CDS:2 [Cetraspora pellucida]